MAIDVMFNFVSSEENKTVLEMTARPQGKTSHHRINFSQCLCFQGTCSLFTWMAWRLLWHTVDMSVVTSIFNYVGFTSHAVRGMSSGLNSMDVDSLASL